MRIKLKPTPADADYAEFLNEQTGAEPGGRHHVRPEHVAGLLWVVPVREHLLAVRGTPAPQ